MKINTVKSFIVFSIVGFFTAVIYFFLFTVFWRWLHLNYKIALSLSFFFSVVFQFTCNRNITFQNKSDDYGAQAIKYVCLLGLNYIITLSIVTYAVGKLLLSPYIGIILSVAVTVIINFFLSKFWVFKETYNTEY